MAPVLGFLAAPGPNCGVAYRVGGRVFIVATEVKSIFDLPPDAVLEAAAEAGIGADKGFAHERVRANGF
jgi:hypothetical protein